MGQFQYSYLQAGYGQHYYSINMPSKKVKSSPKKNSFPKKSNKIVKKKMRAKKSSKKNKEGKKKRTAPAALIKVMNVSGPLAEIIGVKRASRPQAVKGCGLTLRSITCRTQSKGSSLLLMRRWKRSLEKAK